MAELVGKAIMNTDYESESVSAKKGRLKKFFWEQRSRVLAKLPGELDDIWDSAAEDAKLAAKLKPSLVADLEVGGSQMWKELAMPGTFTFPHASAIGYVDLRAELINYKDL